MSERHGNEGASNAAPTRSVVRILAVFAALLVSLTLPAAASADVSFTRAWGWGVSDGASQFETCTSTCTYGIEGGGAGQFDVPNGVATDSSGDVYVADYFNNRVDEFSAVGAFIEAYGWGVVDGASQFETCTSTCQAGLSGGGAGQLDGPEGVAVSPSGDVYVADTGNERIDEFSAAGAFIKAFGSTGYGAGQLETPTGVATDPSGDVYVADSFNNRIDEFSAAGAFIEAYGWGVVDGMGKFETCTSTCQQGGQGGGAGQLNSPDGVATDSSGDVYVSDGANERIDEFSSAGAFIQAWGWGVSDGAEEFETCTTTCYSGGGALGPGAGELDTPTSVAVDGSGDVYVADYDNDRIDEFGAVGAPSTTSTSLSGGGQSGASISVPENTAVSDTATLSGTNASTATGTVTYSVYSNSGCTTAVSTGTAQSITTPGTLPASSAVTLSTPGTYYWQASYSGDSDNAASMSACGPEVETVTSPVVGPPSAQIDSPANGQKFNLDQSVATSFSCSEASGGPGIKSCTDSNGASGGRGALETSTAGPHTYTVTARSKDGQTGTASISYTVTASVRPIKQPTSASIHAKKSAYVNHRVTFWGQITGLSKGIVYFLRKTSAHHWTTIGATRLSRGIYHWTTRLHYTGRQYYKVWFLGDATHAGSAASLSIYVHR